MQDRGKTDHDLAKGFKIFHVLDNGTMVNLDLARITRIMARVPWLGTPGRKCCLVRRGMLTSFSEFLLKIFCQGLVFFSSFYKMQEVFQDFPRCTEVLSKLSVFCILFMCLQNFTATFSTRDRTGCLRHP